jgi:DNA repair photolyase
MIHTADGYPLDKIDPKFRPVWEGRPTAVQRSLGLYFLPHSSSKPLLKPTRPRLICWYCPFADQKDFPSGHRYCINVYTGCAHGCVYCYVMGYHRSGPAPKQDFEKKLKRDLEDLDRFGVPAAPVHLSNSTDPFQPLELSTGHARHALEQLLAYRHRFTTVTLLTKNPLLPVLSGYLELLQKLNELKPEHPIASQFRRQKLPGLRIEVSLAFWREEARKLYDPGAPTIQERKEGLIALREAGLPVVLRIDPLFPLQPDDASWTYRDFGLVQPQTPEDLEALVELAKQLGVMHVVYSPAKITKPRGNKLAGVMQAMKSVYERAAAIKKLPFRGGSWRLPQDFAQATVLKPFLDACERAGVRAKYCKENLVSTP